MTLPDRTALPPAPPQPTDLVLRPGEYAVAHAPRRMRTLLGSCVSITLWHPRRRVGAMSHFLIAERGGSSEGPLDARYGKDALTLMMRGLTQAGVAARECQGKIFGGGNMFPEQNMRGAMQVGRRNGEYARMLLASEGIPISSESLFGSGHRQIIFDLANGHVWSRQIQPGADTDTLDLE